jgi:hypothetical protein
VRSPRAGTAWGVERLDAHTKPLDSRAMAQPARTPREAPGRDPDPLPVDPHAVRRAYRRQRLLRRARRDRIRERRLAALRFVLFLCLLLALSLFLTLTAWREVQRLFGL